MQNIFVVCQVLHQIFASLKLSTIHIISKGETVEPREVWYEGSWVHWSLPLCARALTAGPFSPREGWLADGTRECFWGSSMSACLGYVVLFVYSRSFRQCMWLIAHFLWVAVKPWLTIAPFLGYGYRLNFVAQTPREMFITVIMEQFTYCGGCVVRIDSNNATPGCLSAE